MSELCFTVIVLNLNKFLTISKSKKQTRLTNVILDYSNLQERRNIIKL